MRTIVCWVSLFACLPLLRAAPASDAKTAKVDNVELHYLTAGHGPTVLLLHGFAETSRMWRPLIPVLAERFTVIAPDLPGIGDSSIPVDKIDMLSSASRIHELLHSLGVDKARVVGHDIGLMVAYAYATQFPNETERLALMDAFLPGVEGWEPIYNAPNIWHFRFNGDYPEKLVQGRERTYFEYFWNVLAADKSHSIPEADRKAYAEAYAKPGRMRAAWTYFASWPELARDFAKLSKTKLTIPVLSIGGDKSLGNQLAAQTRLVADNVSVVVLPNTGHWILEERRQETTDALVKFLGDR